MADNERQVAEYVRALQEQERIIATLQTAVSQLAESVRAALDALQERRARISRGIRWLTP